MFYDEKFGWKSGDQMKDLNFEWSLLKCDVNGNYLAIRDIGKGSRISVKIPENHELYRLLLTTTKGEITTSTITTLNTPLVQKESSN